jgi:MoaA/NifB/PqqE/SkfB family radical SAM enzyme
MIYKGIDYSYCWLQIELTDYCNYNCEFCLSGNPLPQTQLTTPHLIWREKKEHEVIFTLTDNDYTEVHLIGDFNYWGILPEGTLTRPTVKNTQMEKKGNLWRKKLQLKTGKYRFAFLSFKNNSWEWQLSSHYEIAQDKYLNLKAHYIEVGNPGELKRGFMEKKLLQNILHQFQKRKITLAEIVPFWFGESLLHPQFENMIELIVKSHIAPRISLHTNAAFLNKNKTDFLLKIAEKLPEGLKISFSIDSIKPETYSQIRRGGQLKNVIPHIIYFLKRASRNKKVLATLQFIVQEKNLEEGEDFFRFWKDFLQKNGIPFKTYFSFDYEKELGKTPVVLFFRALDATSQSRNNYNQIHTQFKEKLLQNFFKEQKKEASSPSIPPKTEVISSNTQYICSSPWRSLFIQWNGETTVCCADTLLNLKIGDFGEDSLEEIWHEGERIKKLRNNHLKQEFRDTFLRCAFCPQWQVPSLSQYEKNLYLEYIKNEK